MGGGKYDAPICVFGPDMQAAIKANAEAVNEWVAKEGGCLVCIGFDDLSWLPFRAKAETRRIHRALLPDDDSPLSIFRGMSLADLHFRRAQAMPVLTEAPVWSVATDPAVIAKIDHERGAYVFFNIDPEKLRASRQLYADEKGWRLLSQVLSNLGAGLGEGHSLFQNVRYMANTKGVPQIPLLSGWKLKLDPLNEGEAAGLHKPVPPGEDWRPVKVPGAWEKSDVLDENPHHEYTPKQRPAPYDGYAWYKVGVTIPAAWKGKPVYFHARCIDDMDWTYVNGEMIGRTTDKESDKYWNAVRHYRIPKKLLRYGETNWIAIRVYDVHGFGGLCRPPVRIEMDPEVVEKNWSPYMDDLDMYDANAFHNW